VAFPIASYMNNTDNRLAYLASLVSGGNCVELVETSRSCIGGYSVHMVIPFVLNVVVVSFHRRQGYETNSVITEIIFTLDGFFESSIY